MEVKNDFPYPKEDNVQFFKDFYAEINGAESFDPVKEWQSEKWSAKINCSRGTVLEKAGICSLHVAGGTINESPASISLFETLVYPANPKVPGFIIMTNMNRTEETGNVLVFYSDLIIQDRAPHEEEKKVFSAVLKNICNKHGHSFKEYNTFSAGQGLLGGSAGECGFVYFFEEKDIAFLEGLIKSVLTGYREILESRKTGQPQQEDCDAANQSRARLVEWIILEDYGIKVARENGIPLEVIEAYAFPPVIRY
jgi:coproporphyrinogen III oxidase